MDTLNGLGARQPGAAFAQSAFARAVAGTGGRLARIVVGLAIVSTGLWRVGGRKGLLLAVTGVAPLAAGALDVCLIAPLFGAPLRGRDIRAHRR